jgi:coenzyme F420-0:L-glutamate ligase / coenzyme F420-1:gamma-L-glutamate ligase
VSPGERLVLQAEPLRALPEVTPHADLAAVIIDAVSGSEIALGDQDVLVVAQKIVSKAEGRLRNLADVDPGSEATEIASRIGRDARLVQLALEESAEVIRAEGGVLITRTHNGLVCANAGIDGSNVPDGLVSLLPADPDGSARRLRASLAAHLGAAPAIVISDSFGRAWRLGQVEVAIGCAGLVPVDDRRGKRDAFGQELTATVLAVADEAASAAGLVRAKEGREAVVIVKGLGRYVTPDDGPGARALIRPRSEDLFGPN